MTTKIQQMAAGLEVNENQLEIVRAGFSKLAILQSTSNLSWHNCQVYSPSRSLCTKQLLINSAESTYIEPDMGRRQIDLPNFNNLLIDVFTVYH